MRKQNNILSVTKNILCLVFTCMVFNACSDEEIIKSSTVKEGIPVEISFGISTPGMDKVTTRSLDEAAESKVNDLYLLVFDGEGRLKTSKFYNTDEIVSSLENKSAGSLSLQTTSGISRIYAVANVQTTELRGVYSALEQVNSVDDLHTITAYLESANVERIQAGLTMSGTFEATGATPEQKKQGYCTIPETDGKMDGKIYLSRLDSHIKFKIAVGSLVKEFTPTSWQVKYVPLKSTVIAQNKNILSLESDKVDYADSKISTSFGTDNENNVKYRTFDFYMLESIKKAQSYNNNSIAEDVSRMSEEDKRKEYAKREEEIKEPAENDKVKNTGVYKYSQKYATYVEIKGSLEINHKNDKGETITRVATVKYVIHLGGGINDPANFTSERNTKYTYLIKIEDVDDIVVEVEKNDERRPGAEGDVVDSQTGVRTLDAHYNCFVMGFSYRDVAGDGNTPNLKFVVKTPFGQVTESSTPDTGYEAQQQDYHWIHFISHGSNNSSKTLATYNKSSLIDLFGLAEDVMQRYNRDWYKNKDKKYYYTVFVDEYYYTKAPRGENWGSDPTTYWHHFANQDNRYVMLVYAPKYSQDNESSYAKAQYMVTQRSIQTYYSTESDKALGMEHVNESGYGNWGTPGITISSANGLANTWNYLKKNSKWDTYVTRTEWDSDNNTFTTIESTRVLARCLSRNRDEDGNGEISLDEVKWYVPTSEQLMGMYLGAQSLPSPLFDADNISFVYANRVNHHYGTSDNKRIWSEEGASIGDFGQGHTAGATPKNFRCVRNLGIDKKKGDKLTNKENEDYPKKAFDFKERNTKVRVFNPTFGFDVTTTANNIFVMDRLTEQNIRGRIQVGEIGLHNNFENNNKPYKAFQMSKVFKETDRKGSGELVSIRDSDKKINLHTWDVIIRSYWYDTENGTKYLKTDNDRSFCKDYFEDDIKEKGLWRAPNQRELMLMYIEDNSFVYPSGGKAYGSLSRTAWKYEGSNRHFAANVNIYLTNPGQDDNNKYYIRCVRDVEIAE